MLNNTFVISIPCYFLSKLGRLSENICNVFFSILFRASFTIPTNSIGPNSLHGVSLTCVNISLYFVIKVGVIPTKRFYASLTVFHWVKYILFDELSIPLWLICGELKGNTLQKIRRLSFP